MKTKILSLTAILLFLFAAVPVVAQTTGFNVQGIVLIQADSIDTSGDTLNIIRCKFQLQDTLHVSKIHIRFGNGLHNDKFMDTSFVFDSVNNLPFGCSYVRTGYTVYLTLGYFRPETYYIDAKLEDVFGAMSQTQTIRF